MPRAYASAQQMTCVHLFCALAVASSSAAATHRFEAPGGRLADSIVILGRQAGVSIAAFGAPVSGVRGRPVHGLLTLDQALDILLKDTGFTYRTLPNGSILIVPNPKRSPPPPAPPPPASAFVASEIVVTGSKRKSPLSDYPGAVMILNVDPRQGPTTLTDGTNAIIDQAPVMASTYLGPGRDKLFIQGIADSSYNGYSTATVAQYLGDIRLTYNAPDPDLNLYDMKQVEILEGPQATLYGAGSLGGILRLVPNDPDPRKAEGSLAAGYINTEHGASGGDISGMLNIPIISDKVAIRAVGYEQIEPGYIDDSLRNLKNINQVVVSGGRVTARIEPGDGWTVDIGGIIQIIHAPDHQYALENLPPFTQQSLNAQPFNTQYYLAQIIIKRQLGNLDFTSATGFVRENSLDLLNAEDALTSSPSVSHQASRITMISNETRLSGRLEWMDFVSGLSSLYSTGSYSYEDVADPSSPYPSLVDETLVDNRISDVAAFGEADFHLPWSLSLTTGGRLESVWTTSWQALTGSFQGQSLYSLQDGQPIPVLDGRSDRTDARFVPAVALSWKPFHQMLTFARYQQSFRPGGFEPQIGGSGDTPEILLMRYGSDHIDTVQAGFRYGSTQSGPFALGVTLSRAFWHDIQAVQLDLESVPNPVNIGDATIDSIEASAMAQPIKALVLQISVFADKATGLAKTQAQMLLNIPQAHTLPVIPNASAVASAAYGFSPFAGAEVTVHASVRYTGASELDTYDRSPPYTVADTGARLGFGRYGISLDATNITNTIGNQFAGGNPTGEAAGELTTPLRPRSIRLGVDASF